MKLAIIGLPGVGKKTAINEVLKLLNVDGVPRTLLNIDSIIHEQFEADNEIVKEFTRQKGITIPEVVYSNKEHHVSELFIKHLGEELFRDLEEMFVLNVIENCKANDWPILGGKAIHRPAVVKALSDNGIVLVHLCAEYETTIKRLEREGEWRKRGMFSLKGEDGWRQFAKEIRESRLSEYFELADVTIQAEKENGEEKMPAEIAKEIIEAIK